MAGGEGTIYEEPLPTRFVEDERKLVFRRRTHGPRAYRWYRSGLFKAKNIILMTIVPATVYWALFYENETKPFTGLTKFRMKLFGGFAGYIRGVSDDDMRELYARDRLQVSPSDPNSKDYKPKLTDYKLETTWLPFVSGS